MRIIAGEYRRRTLRLPPPCLTRPTSDRAREAIFNIIYSLDDKIFKNSFVLDAFAGSGALGLEALSRGASQVTFFEKNPQAMRILKSNIATLQVETHCSVFLRDAIKPPKASNPMNLVFLDPPYGQNLEIPCLKALQAQGWIHGDTLIVLETSSKDPACLPNTPQISLIGQRSYGAALISFLKLKSNFEHGI